jgi:hypothetical protein
LVVRCKGVKVFVVLCFLASIWKLIMSIGVFGGYLGSTRVVVEPYPSAKGDLGASVTNSVGEMTIGDLVGEEVS